MKRSTSVEREGGPGQTKCFQFVLRLSNRKERCKLEDMKDGQRDWSLLCARQGRRVSAGKTLVNKTKRPSRNGGGDKKTEVTTNALTLQYYFVLSV